MHNTMQPMQTLDQHNEQRRMQEAFAEASRNKAGVACPSCKTEMIYSNPGTMNLSKPPTMDVKCPSCGHSGRKL